MTSVLALPTSAGEDDPPGGDYVLPPVFGVRVAESTVADLRRPRFDRTWTALDEHVELSRRLRARTTAISSQLYSLIGPARGEAKSRLVALRRSVYQLRDPGPRVWAAATRELLGPELAEQVTGWLGLLARAKRVEHELPALFAADASAANSALREAAAALPFRFRLQLSAPPLAEALGDWLDRDRPLPPRALTRLARELSRAATGSRSCTEHGLGRWVGDEDTGPAGALNGRRVAELNRRALWAIWAEVARHPRVRPHVRVRLNPTTTGPEDPWFLGTGPEEPVFALPTGDLPAEAVRFLRATPEATLTTLTAHLGATAGDRAGQDVEYLIGIGLVELCPPFDDPRGEPLEQLASWVDSVAGPRRAGPLRAVAELVGGFSECADARSRANRLDAIGRAVSALTEGQVWTGPDLLTDTTVLTDPVTSQNLARWRPVLDDLNALRGFLGVFHPQLDEVVTAATFFTEHFGPGASVGFLEFFYRWRTEAPALKPTHTAISAEELTALRARAARALYGAPERDGVIHHDPRQLAAIAAGWPSLTRTPSSICCLGNELPGTDGPRLVLNSVEVGHGATTQRIGQLMGRVGDGQLVGRPAPAGTGAGVVPLECRGAFETSAPALELMLDYPRVSPPTPPATSLRLSDLRVSHDRATGRLVLRDPGGVEVRPLAVGTQSEDALPPAPRLLVRLFGEPQLALAPEQQLGERGWRPGESGPDRRPRLQVGRVVLARAGWSVPIGQFPRHEPGEPPASYLLRCAHWRDRLGLPRQGQVSVLPHGGARRPSYSGTRPRAPLYLDFTNWYLLKGLERSLAPLRRSPARVVFTEALPALADAPHYGRDGQRVTEYLIELSQAGGVGE